MQALILAAGQGRRLEDRRRRPKCMRQVGGVPLVRHQLLALGHADIEDIVIVVGFAEDQIRRSVGSGARYVVNPRFAETNSMYSFLVAREVIRDDVIVMNSDVFFHPAMLARLLDVGGDALLYDSASGDQGEQMKVCVDDGYLIEMSKSMAADRVSGENVGVLRLSLDTVDLVAAAARVIADEGGEWAWLAAAINRVAAKRRIRCIDVAGWPWVEIDFPEDLARARTEVFPSVVTANGHRKAEPLGTAALLKGVS